MEIIEYIINITLLLLMIILSPIIILIMMIYEIKDKFKKRMNEK